MNQTISTNGLIGEIEKASTNGAFMASITLATEPTLKAGHGFGNVRKLAKVSVVGNSIYANAVNKIRVKSGFEPDFEPAARSWGERLIGVPFVSHKGELYLEYRVLNVLSEAYFDAAGDLIPSDAIAPYLRDSKPANGVQWRTCRMASIVGLCMSGVEFTVAEGVLA